MLIGKNALYRRQMDFVTEMRQDIGRASERQQSGENVTDEKQKAQQKDSFQASEEGLLRLYQEQIKIAQKKAKNERDARNDELRAIKIAHNIMRGYRVPQQDESFLLTKNFKMYMAAKNLSMMRECQGEAGSELGDVRSGMPSDAVQTESAKSAGINAGEISSGAKESAVLGAPSGGANQPDESKSSVAIKNNSFADYYKYLEEQNRAYGSTQSTAGLNKLKKKKTKTRRRFFYNFKDVSNRIVRARTSGNARQVYTSAKVKCAQLRRKLRTGDYDDEALRIAIVHAEAMERVAKKKMKHLQEEEIAKRGGPCAGDTEREDIEEQMRLEEQEQMEQNVQDSGRGMSFEQPGLSDDRSIEELMADSMQSDVQMLDLASGMEMFIEEFAALMKDATEELTGLSVLAEELMGVSAEPDMDPEDLKELKLKHRTEEQRKIAEADSKYLKALFQKLQREQQAVAQGAARIAEAIVGDSNAVLSLTGGAPSASGKTAGTASAAGSPKGSAQPSPAADVSAEMVSLSAAKESLSAGIPAVSTAEAVSAAAAGASFDISV